MNGYATTEINHQVALHKHLGIEIDKSYMNFPSNFLHPPQFPSVFCSISREWANSVALSLTVHLTLMHCVRILPQQQPDQKLSKPRGEM